METERKDVCEMWNQFSPYGYPPPTVPAMASYQPASQPQPQTGLDWIMAQTVKQVEQVSVQPGQKAWVMVQNEPIFALRTADQMGLVTTSYYRFEKYEPGEPVAEPEQYVTRREFEEFVKSVKEAKE
jgi:hypothetical protein